MTDVVMVMVNDFCKLDFVLLISSEISSWWWDKEAHKVTYFIILDLTECSFG